MVWHLETWGHRLRTVAFYPHVRLVMRSMFGRDGGVMLGQRWPLKKHGNYWEKHARLRLRFLETHGEIVIKPLHGNGGKAIFKVESDGANLSALIEVFNMTWREPHMVQAFLPDVAKGDKRIVLVDGDDKDNAINFPVTSV